MMALVRCWIVVALLMGQTAMAQPQNGGISATGSESVSVKPDKLRLVMLIKAQGADAKAAMTALNEHKEKVKKELETMKADKESILFSAARASSGSGESANHTRRMYQMQMQMARGGKPAPPKAMPTVYTATCTLKAEWPLPVKEGDALALLPVTLKEQIVSRDIAGEKNKPKLSRAEQEQLEEMEAMMEDDPFGNSGPEENQNLRIHFVGAIPEDTKKKLLAAAYKKAVHEVEETSAATGVHLAKLQSLSSTSAEPNEADFFAARRYSSYGTGTGPSINPSFLKDGPGVIAGTNPDDLEYSVTVTVVFDIQ